MSSDDSWGQLTWQVGAYYSYDSQAHDSITNFRDHSDGFSAEFFQHWEQDTESIAVFSQVEWDFSEKWRLIGGLRYTEEDREFTYIGSKGEGGIGPSPVAFFTDKIDAAEFSGKIGVDYTNSDDLLVYASINRGFKAGGFPASIAFREPQFFPFEPETLLAYEAGFKSTLADGKVRFNSAVYTNAFT